MYYKYMIKTSMYSPLIFSPVNAHSNIILFCFFGSRSLHGHQEIVLVIRIALVIHAKLTSLSCDTCARFRTLVEENRRIPDAWCCCVLSSTVETRFDLDSNDVRLFAVVLTQMRWFRDDLHVVLIVLM